MPKRAISKKEGQSNSKLAIVWYRKNIAALPAVGLTHITELSSLQLGVIPLSVPTALREN